MFPSIRYRVLADVWTHFFRVQNVNLLVINNTVVLSRNQFQFNPPSIMGYNGVPRIPCFRSSD